MSRNLVVLGNVRGLVWHNRGTGHFMRHICAQLMLAVFDSKKKPPESLSDLTRSQQHHEPSSMAAKRELILSSCPVLESNQ
jgi:hypothetical protein